MIGLIKWDTRILGYGSFDIYPQPYTAGYD